MENRTHGGQEHRQPKKRELRRGIRNRTVLMWLSPETNTKSRTESIKWLIQKAEVHQQEPGEAKQGRKAASEVCVLSKFLPWASGA